MIYNLVVRLLNWMFVWGFCQILNFKKWKINKIEIKWVSNCWNNYISNLNLKVYLTFLSKGYW